MDTEKRGSVLVVEDNALERESLLAMLRRANFSAFGVADAQSALLAIEFPEEDVDVVLCDIRLHGESGVDLLCQWKQRRPATPFIFVSGVYDVAQIVEAVKLGAEDYITKPYNSAELVRRVAECIDAAHEHGAPTPRCVEYLSRFEARFDVPSDMTLEEIERVVIETTLERTRGNRTRAAQALGISVRTLQRKLKSWHQLSEGAGVN